MPSKITTQTKRDVIAVIQAMIADTEKGICLRRAEIEHLRRKRGWLQEKLRIAEQQEPTDAE